jgi:peptidoglycan/xylan/chitin deacetylase (PgdA/CDA1 family)
VARRVLSLIYHDVAPREQRDSAGFPGPVAGVYKLEPAHFSAHLAAIAATGVETGVDPARSDAMLTFDDGGASSMWIADELERHRMRGAFFIVTERLGTPGFIDAGQVRELSRRGHLIGSHSHSHPSFMGRLDAGTLGREWTESRETLAGLLGAPPQTAAVPGGSVSPAVLEQAARAGYRYIFTSTPRARTQVRHGAEIIGRYTMWAADPPALAAAVVQGHGLPRLRRLVSWQVKSAAKRVSPRLYESARAAKASHTA